MTAATLEFLGSGTSQGVPVIGCTCNVCRSADPKDKRLRASALVRYAGLNILVDCGPDFRTQALRAGIRQLDAILLTHEHMDHIGGLDDTRALQWTLGWEPEIWCEQRVLDALRKTFHYVFKEEVYPGVPTWHIHVIDERPFIIKGVEIIPVRCMHGKMPILGYRFGNIAYLTDVSAIADQEMEKLRGLDAVTINCVMRTPHHSHFSLPQALDFLEKVGAKESYITHISHYLGTHSTLESELPPHVHAAYDGLVIGSPSLNSHK